MLRHPVVGASHVRFVSLRGWAMALMTVGFGLGVVAPGCQCISTDNFVPVHDAGEPPHDAGPPPPTFPLKIGDQLSYPALGGRIDTCNGGAGANGECQRIVKATYVVKGVTLGGDNTWTVNSDVLYEGIDDTIPAAAIGQLVLSHAVPFNAVTTATPQHTTGATFITGAAPTDELTPNGFPFFQFDPATSAQAGSAFELAATAFHDRIVSIDPDARINTQVAGKKLEAFFKDTLGPTPMLHKVLAELHPMGFVCGWDEGLIPFVDGAARAQSDFDGVSNPPLVATFVPSIQLKRDGVSYICDCFSQKCKTLNGSPQLCLDPTNPDAPAAACN
jgi:hypothetical protein